jgi:hypothetical protein
VPDRRNSRRAIPAFNRTKDEYSLKNNAHPSFTDRKQHAAEAKKKLLEKFKTAPKLDDPELAAKRAEREAIAAARETRRLERERLNAETQARKAAERLAREEAALAAEQAEIAAREAEEKLELERHVAEEAAKKAERDARYAARKKRR